MQISKIQQPPIFAQKLQISIKLDFPNRFFYFLQECVQEGVYFGAHMVPSDDHFLKVVSGLQMAWLASVHAFMVWKGTWLLIYKCPLTLAGIALPIT